MPRSSFSLPLKAANELSHDRTEEFPTEIITEIFIFVCGPGVLLPPPIHKYPWILGYVCSRWRQILWNTPAIWNKITIGYRGSKIPKVPVEGYCGRYMEKYTVDDILSYILLSTTYPISLNVTNDEYVRKAPHIVYKNLDRFSELSVVSGLGLSFREVSFIFDLPASAFTQLEKLSLSSLDVDERYVDYGTAPLQTAPSLRSVSYKMKHPTYIPSFLLLPWSIIEDITIDGMCIPPEIIWNILRSSPRLVSCLLNIDATIPIPGTPKLSLPHLPRFGLRTLSEFNWDFFLSHILAPSLKSVTLQSPFSPCTPLVSLVERSQCSVKNLSLSTNDGNVSIDPTDFGLLLDRVPSLVTFKSSWVAPPSTFTRIYQGVLPDLAELEVPVHPDGLRAFMKLIDWCIVDPAQRRLICFRVVWYCSPFEFSTEQDRFMEYSRMGDQRFKFISGTRSF
ncbi:hypothetical protein BDZ94DRAFT_1318890 [Collybia nuda]|uniref:F-box domain-containing protein n=1 Tax=Collybia nuda TaxID=64659 RepID=A0A9P6CI85_9AGAR|nr:hypothetical protein BDZ94DRAFT_1318890 [Collybia nuda]